MHKALRSRGAVAGALAIAPLLAACADAESTHLVAASSPTTSLRARPTTITLSRDDALPYGAVVVPLAEERGAPDSARSAGTDAVLGGGAGAETVLRTVLYPRARACYADVEKRDPTARGRIVLALDVTKDGNVVSSVAELATGLSPDVVACVETSAKNVIFPPPGGRGEYVKAPMRFAPDDTDAAADHAALSSVVPIVRDCYAAARDGGGRGKIEFIVRVGASGSVEDVRGTRDESVGGGVPECAVPKLRATRFDTLAGREIVVPLVLRHAADAR